MSRVIVLGGDGYLGWPVALRLSREGHSVKVADNYFRRQNASCLNLPPLYDLPDLPSRAKAWFLETGLHIGVSIMDLRLDENVKSLITGDGVSGPDDIFAWDGPPDAVIHLAEQPSAPYSMMNNKAANETLTNNLLVTNNLVYAVKNICPEIHIIKLGTMGEYGTPNIDIEEGWLDITHKGRSDRFLFPRAANSIYHTSKIMDTDLLWLAVRTWGLTVTDLMQGPVYGCQTNETGMNWALRNVFSYDEIFGTVLNRFVTQAVSNSPITVYGLGEQKRGYINIEDSLQCISLSVENPPDQGTLRIFNQITETFSVNELAQRVKKVADRRALNPDVVHITNPRTENENHYYNPLSEGLLTLGLKPHYLTDNVLEDFFDIVSDHKEAINARYFSPTVSW
jgi:UDP-sulfoquinovose synthase